MDRAAAGLLRGATVGIVGAGGIGRQLITMMSPLGVRVLAVTRSGGDVPGAARSYRADQLLDILPDDILPDADYIVLAAPATPGTRALIGASELAAMRPTSWLVNIARGSLVDTDALVTGPRSGQIAGAALDVTDPEPLPEGHPLWTEPVALITPHCANPESLALPQLAGRMRTNVKRFLAGEPLEAVVDPDAGY